MVFLFPAVLGSLFSAFKRVEMFRTTIRNRNMERSWTEHLGKMHRHRIGEQGTSKMSLAQLAVYYHLAQDQRKFYERQSISEEDRMRAYMHFLLACVEDGPFCVLNYLLVLANQQQTSAANVDSECRTFLEQSSSPGLLLFIFASSFGALSYKAMHLLLFPVIWAECRKLDQEKKLLDEREDNLLLEAEREVKEEEESGLPSKHRTSSCPRLHGSIVFDAVTLNGGPPTALPSTLEQKGAMTRICVGRAGVSEMELVCAEATRAGEQPEVSNIRKMAKLPVAGSSSVRFQTSAIVEQRESVLPLTGSGPGGAGVAVNSQKDQMIKMFQGRVDEPEDKLKNVSLNASSHRTLDAVHDAALAPLSEPAQMSNPPPGWLERHRSEHRQWSEWHHLEQQATPRLPASPATYEPDVF